MYVIECMMMDDDGWILILKGICILNVLSDLNNYV